KRQYRLGVLSVGLFSRCGRAAGTITGTDDGCAGEAERSLAHRAQPYFALAGSAADGSREHNYASAGACEAKRALAGRRSGHRQAKIFRNSLGLRKSTAPRQAAEACLTGCR